MFNLIRKAVIAATILISTNAYCIISPLIITPNQPNDGQTVSVNFQSALCHSFPEVVPPEITQSGNLIEVRIVGTQGVSGCMFPLQAHTIPFGNYPSGQYTVRFIGKYHIPSQPTQFFEEVIETLPMSVSSGTGAGAGNVSVPGLSRLGILLLILTMGLAGMAIQKRRASMVLAILLTAAVVHPTVAEAGETLVIESKAIQVLLSRDATATMEPDVISFINNPDLPLEQSPIDAFRRVRPSSANFLLSERAGQVMARIFEQNPELSRAKLERYLVLHYSEGTDMNEALTSLLEDAGVAAAYRAANTVVPNVAQSASGPITQPPVDRQYSWDQLNIGAMWDLAGGYAVIGLLDSGLEINHPALRQFDALGNYVGGNFILGVDVGRQFHPIPVTDLNVDEQEVEPIDHHQSCYLPVPYYAPPDYAGHGTHTSGLASANATQGAGLKGTCKHCGIHMFRVSFAYCSGYQITSFFEENVTPDANALASQTGSQVVNMSLVIAPLSNYCFHAGSNHPHCLELDTLDKMGVVVVAASGNSINDVAFPANDDRVIAVGGTDSSGALWDDSPNCPYPFSNQECGSNYTQDPLTKQELVAGAKEIESLFYTGLQWNPEIHCGDAEGGVNGDGDGLCTGTSMSTPQVAGIAGVLRSINPLVLPGKPDPASWEKWGVRTVLAKTTIQAQASVGWQPTLGYGIPDGAAAARKMLGTVAGATVRNRVTPLFSFYSAVAKDYAETTTPQVAIALSINAGNYYTPTGANLFLSSVPAYAFPSAYGQPPTPRADTYVLTTEYSPFEQYSLVPLHQMNRERPHPVGCVVGASGCNGANRDYTLMTKVSDIEYAHNDGFNLSAIQGYIFAPCSEGATSEKCKPPGTQEFYRACKASGEDCATFLEGKRSTFEANGYLYAYPAGSDKLLGYAYPAVDSDSDGLVDGFELVIGTDPNDSDTDDDLRLDGREFPMDGISQGDPCNNDYTNVNYCL